MIEDVSKYVESGGGFYVCDDGVQSDGLFALWQALSPIHEVAVLAPDLIGTRCRDPRITLTVMACCLRAAVAARPQGRDLLQALERIDAQLDRLQAQQGRRWARLRNVGAEPGVLAVISTLRVVLRHTNRSTREMGGCRMRS